MPGGRRSCLSKRKWPPLRPAQLRPGQGQQPRRGIVLRVGQDVGGQAALGCELEVPTLDGKVKYTIPSGTQPGTVFRLRDKGIKYLRQDRHGDLYVKMNVVVPRKLTERQKELILEMEGMPNTREHKKGRGIFKK